MLTWASSKVNNWSLINTYIKLNLNVPLHVHVFLDNCIIPLTIIAISFFGGFEVLFCFGCDVIYVWIINMICISDLLDHVLKFLHLELLKNTFYP